MRDKEKPGHLQSSLLSIHIVRMLKGIPEDLLFIFAPSTTDEMIQFELNIARFKSREDERNAVMRLQRKAGLSLCPNIPFNRCMVFARLAELKRRKENSEDSYLLGGESHL